MRPQLNSDTVGARPNLRQELESQGFTTVADAVDEADRARLSRLLEVENLPRGARHPSGPVFAARHLLIKIPELGFELTAAGVDSLAAELLGSGAFPIDAAFFDKQPDANWTVPVHQDRVFPVVLDRDRKHRVADGVVVAEPSATTLARLLALRIHFDPTDPAAGALFVLPGSHAAGIVESDAPPEPLASFVACVAGAGDVLAMRPLLLHRSPPSKRSGRRRVLHVVYATDQPDDGLRWRASAQQAVAAEQRHIGQTGKA
jgi:hypothetical protein